MPIQVLLVEDNQPDVMLVRQALGKGCLEFAFHEMGDAEAAAAYIERMGDREDSPCPDIVLLDLNVPKGDGFELLKAFRESPKCPGVPIIVMTSSDSPRDRAKATEMGTTLYFRKPIELEEFLLLGNLVEEVLKNSLSRKTEPAMMVCTGKNHSWMTAANFASKNEGLARPAARQPSQVVALEKFL